MQVRFFCSTPVRPLVLSLTLITPACFAKGSVEPPIDPTTLAAMEQKATVAPAKEQAILYTELAERLTLLAAHQIQDGNAAEAAATLDRVEHCTESMQKELSAGSKDLKKAELRLHDTQRRLGDLVRIASSEMKPHVQSTLKRMNDAQRSLLALLFAK